MVVLSILKIRSSSSLPKNIMNIAITNLQSKFPIPQKKITRIITLSAKRLKLNLEEVSVVFVGEGRMRTLNKMHLRHDYVTDVLTFGYKARGEVVICPSVASSNAHHFKSSLERELLLYVVHGLLHLAGFNDHKPADIARMRLKEEELLRL